MAVFLFAGVIWVFDAPRPPALPSDPQAAQAAIANYKPLAETAHDGTLRFFDATVGKVLYPAFTLILGFIFGRGGKGTAA